MVGAERLLLTAKGYSRYALKAYCRAGATGVVFELRKLRGSRLVWGASDRGTQRSEAFGLLADELQTSLMRTQKKGAHRFHADHWGGWETVVNNERHELRWTVEQRIEFFEFCLFLGDI